MKMGHGMRTTGRRLGRFLKMVGAAYGVALAPTVIPAVVVLSGGPPPRRSLTREALIRWVEGTRLGSYGS
jgi:hypothetical protein